MNELATIDVLPPGIDLLMHRAKLLEERLDGYVREIRQGIAFRDHPVLPATPLVETGAATAPRLAMSSRLKATPQS